MMTNIYRAIEELKLVVEKMKEELKTTRIALEKAKKENWKLGYQKAIEDFTEKAKAECRKHYVDCDPYFGGIVDSILYEDDIDEIAEQLKAGETDE